MRILIRSIEGLTGTCMPGMVAKWIAWASSQDKLCHADHAEFVICDHAIDITYVRLQNEFIYLAVILDGFSRRCIAWALSRQLDTSLTLAALQRALEQRTVAPGLVHHSDRGVQYASQRYTELLKSQGIQISMSRRGNPYDNAFAESFIKTLKYEEVHLNDYESFAEAHESIEQFLEDVYNHKRLHSALGYRPPAEFEQALSTPSPP